MPAEKYATIEDVIYFVQLYDEGFDTTKVNDTFMKICNARIDAWIVENGKRVTNNMTDPLNLLWSAVICFAIEYFTYTGAMAYSSGDLALTKLNRATYQFQRWQPMFFFATGASDPFKGLLPHESNRMMAYAFVDAYCRDDFFRQYGSPYPIPKITRDDTDRGWSWNLHDQYKRIANYQSKYDGVTGYEDIDSYYALLDDGPL